MIIAILVFVTAIHAMYCPNFSITGELLRNLWGKICVQGYLSGVCYQEIAWFLLSEVILIDNKYVFVMPPMLCIPQISALQMNC